MSILESNKIDMIGIPTLHPYRVVLGISDHLAWAPTEEEGHLLLLQEKLNHYLAFIESGEMIVAFPAASEKKPVIRLIAKHPLSKVAQEFLDSASSVMTDAGIALEIELSPPATDK
jgi:hypothetical protein